MDALDGRVARATRTGSQFGVELDSLVDAISFGVAPAFIMYFAVLNRDSWAWLVCFAYIACAVMRLARFNVEQGGRAKTHFHGLPSPAAGMTLATYYWFTQTTWYHYVDAWPWHTVLPGVMLTLSFLMISHVLYPAMPRVSLRNVSGIVGAVLLFAAIVAILLRSASLRVSDTRRLRRLRFAAHDLLRADGSPSHRRPARWMTKTMRSPRSIQYAVK